MALPLRTGGGKPEGSRSKFYFFTSSYILTTSSPSASNLPSNPKFLFRSPQTEKPLVKNHSRDFTPSRTFSESPTEPAKGSNTPANSQKNTEWER
ncbi:hypothetical protein AVEN_136660-1 [Araneus ventricosus]|uniref:Uncharacterized protein n=1 Tax=Araneus ventricosus TaxID=182803 RepID=A0A4Y2G927_ARAVE|nr:hypothetical protein AVEN_106152-1 [Araneus ventricosus]GBM49139.1 hypothetical protein AVEN_136660-1 [Araneus ventricosus]